MISILHHNCFHGLVVCTPDFHPGGRGSIPQWNFCTFFHFFQTLGAKKGHTRHVLPCLLYTTELRIIQRSFWYMFDRVALSCKILTLVREIRHFWSYFMSFSYFLPSQKGTPDLKSGDSSLRGFGNFQPIWLKLDG